MTALSQDEIVSSTKTVIQGLDTLKNEHHQILNSLLSSLKTIKRESGDTNLVEEKTNILKKSLETIELGISEAQVGETGDGGKMAAALPQPERGLVGGTGNGT